jgi:hypothetical protein
MRIFRDHEDATSSLTRGAPAPAGHAVLQSAGPYRVR